MKLADYLLSLCAQFDLSGAEYALAGGFAFSLHVAPRSTADIDIVAVAGSIDVIEKAMKNIFPRLIRHKNAIHLPGVLLYRLVGVQGDREIMVDVIVPENSLLLSSILERKVLIDFNGVNLPVVSIEDLYVLKNFSNRLQDKSDCEMIEEIRGPDLDREYIGRWIH